ncbi:hypothetical protein E5206_05610 [Arthrobacter sp. PAMC25564]|uniref:hypothetical protein n=1 Tax=Arthrobacter sp. PAMC25564 TaxID=2565366 RepID=UPI0010A2A70B|nr:hypothetical protein [Arthrobacter sp. PAMC25564]QCB96466.1 hypothetical protein E5206_05610 [Arthrobacter sp. PAMC25564]
MNQPANGQLHPPVQKQGNIGPAGFGEEPRFTVDRQSGKKNEAVLGPFTIRDLTVFGSTLILFVASLIPMFGVRYNLWNLGSLFFLGLGIVLPLIVSALFVARRVSPGTRIRIGSLSVDQFASVVAAFSLAFFFLAVAGAFAPSMLVALVGALGLFAATVLARLIPYFAGDFLGRGETPAHVVAREAAVPVRKPRAPKAPAAGTEAGPKDAASSPIAGWAKRLKPGSPAAAPGAAPRGYGSNGSAPSGAVPAAAVPAAAAGEEQTSVPASSAPETHASDVVTGAASATPLAAAAHAPVEPTLAAEPSATPSTVPSGTPSAEAPTLAAGVEVPSASAAGATSAPEAPAVPSAVEETRAADLPSGSGSYAPTTVNPQVRLQEPIGATVDPASRPVADEVQPVHEAFWFAVAQPRTAVDEHTGVPAFVIEPGGWVLALEDRGHEFLVQHTDGRVGVLRDLSSIERG